MGNRNINDAGQALVFCLLLMSLSRPFLDERPSFRHVAFSRSGNGSRWYLSSLACQCFDRKTKRINMSLYLYVHSPICHPETLVF